MDSMRSRGHARPDPDGGRRPVTPKRTEGEHPDTSRSREFPLPFRTDGEPPWGSPGLFRGPVKIASRSANSTR